jgi:penicillin-binding protein 2
MRAGIAHSCDVYFYTLGAPDQTADNNVRVHYYNPGDTTQHYFHGLGIERIEDYLKNVYGFGRPTGIELAGEADGLVPSPKWLLQSDLNENWSIGDTINISIGQGHLLGTPLQLLMGTALIANGGKRYQPRLIKELIDDDGKVVKRFEPKLVRDMTEEPDDDDTKWLKPEHIRVVHEGMKRTATEGTGMGKITIQNVEVAAKSGTAEFGEVDPETGRYLSGHAWFSAYAPAEDPEICVVALVVGGYEGSTYAGPIVDDILKAYFEAPGIRDSSRVEMLEPE